jgi:hypothetical protein
LGVGLASRMSYKSDAEDSFDVSRVDLKLNDTNRLDGVQGLVDIGFPRESKV